MATQYLFISFPWIDFRDDLRFVRPPAIIRILMTRSAVPVWNSQVPICWKNIPVDLHGKWLSAYCLMVCSVTVSIISSCSGAAFAANTPWHISPSQLLETCRYLCNLDANVMSITTMNIRYAHLFCNPFLAFYFTVTEVESLVSASCFRVCVWGGGVFLCCLPPALTTPLRRPLKVHVKSRQTAAHWFSPQVAAGCLHTLTLTKTGELERRLPSSLNSYIKAFIKEHTASSDGHIIYIICCSYPFHPFSVLSFFSPFPPHCY